MTLPDKTFPAILGRSWFAWLWWTVPQVLLLLLNLGDYQLIADELTAGERHYWTVSFSISAGLLLVGLGIPFFLRSSRGQIAWFIACILLPAGFIFHGTTTVDHAVPDTVDFWILHPGNLVFNLWAFQVFASLYGFSWLCGRIAASGGFSTLFLGIAATVVPVGLLWLVVQFFSDLLGGSDYFFTLLTATVAVVTVVLAFGVFLIALSLLRAIFREQRNLTGIGLTLLVALVLPIAGLALNRSIPFPQDYQNTVTYFLTVINAMVLAIPAVRGDRFRRLQLFGTAALLPFSLYFFCAFLPFYPLSALAMIAVGAGFLILTPLLLTVVHLGKIGLLHRSLAGKGKNVLLIGAGIALLPSFLFVGMIRDRAAILEALDYTISPNPTQLQRAPDAGRVEHVVEAVVQQSRGIQYPILSPLYRVIVLQGMTLPDSTIGKLEKTFGFEAEEDANGFVGFWGVRERGPNLVRRLRTAPALGELRGVEFAADGSEGLTLAATVVNDSPDPRTEFRETFTLPPGVWVSGAELLIGDEWKPAAIRERRSAEWIYRMITSERQRDPLLVTLASPGEVEVRVFPVDKDQSRELRLHLESVYPEVPPLAFGGFEWHPGPVAGHPAIVDAGSNLLVSDAARLPARSLPPVYHLILDRSQSGLNRGELRKAVGSTLAAIPAGAPIRWWAIHDGVRALADFPGTNHPDVSTRIDWSKIPKDGSGGRSGEHVVLAILHEWREDLRAGEVPRHYPVTVPVGWEPASPDRSDFLEYINPRMGAVFQWLTAPDPALPAPPRPVAIFRRGGSTGIIPAETDRDAARWVFLFETAGAVEILNEGDSFELLDESLIFTPESISGGLRVLLGEYHSRYDPALHEEERPRLISQSKEFSVLLPETALIVLETSAQEEFLKRLEETGMEAHSGLSFSETPEPATLVLIGFVLWLFVRRDGCNRPSRNF